MQTKFKNFSTYGSGFLSILLLTLLCSCQPDAKKREAQPSPATPQAPVQYENKEAQPTVAVPPTTAQATGNSSDTKQPAVRYEEPPKALINKVTPITSATADSATGTVRPPLENRVEVLLGRLRIETPLVSFNSVTKLMSLQGTVAVLDQERKEIAKRPFRLIGTKREGMYLIELAEESQSQENFKIKALAQCIAASGSAAADCRHVVFDILVKYNENFMTEQLEVRPEAAPAEATSQDGTGVISVAPTVMIEENKVSGTEMISGDASTLPVVELSDRTDSSEVVIPRAVVEVEENKGRISTQLQYEESDGSLPGRYQGFVQTVDLNQVFRDQTDDVSQRAEERPTPIALNAAATAASSTARPRVRTLPNGFVQLDTGVVRPANQAHGIPNGGHIKNPVSLSAIQQTLKDNTHFEVVVPNRKKHFSTFELSELVGKVSGESNRRFQKKLYLLNASTEKGGKMPPHASHQNGIDIDIAYPATGTEKIPLVVKMKPRQFYTNNYSTEKTYEIFKLLFSQQDVKVDRIFVDESIKQDLCRLAKSKKEFEGTKKEFTKYMFQNLQHVYGHGDHFHVRVKCSSFDPNCRSVVYRKMETCGVK